MTLVSWHRLLEGVEVVTGSIGSTVTVTATIVSSKKQAIVFDTLMWPEETAQLVQGLKSQGLEVKALVDTHWHVDHVAGNQLFTSTILGQSQCPQLMRSRLPEQLEGDARLKDVRPALPHGLFEEKMILPVGDRKISLLHLPGHTPDSLVGLLEEERVLIAGDTVIELPFILYGDSTQLIESLRTIQAMDVDAIIQGHGEVCNKTKIAGDINYLETGRRIVAEYIGSETPRDKIVNLPIEMFLPAERCAELEESFKKRVHLRNLETLYKELSRSENPALEI